MGKGRAGEKRIRRETHCSIQGGRGGRQTEGPSSQRKVNGGGSFSHLEAAAEQGPPPPQPQVLGVLPWGPG